MCGMYYGVFVDCGCVIWMLCIMGVQVFGVGRRLGTYSVHVCVCICLCVVWFMHACMYVYVCLCVYGVCARMCVCMWCVSVQCS